MIVLVVFLGALQRRLISAIAIVFVYYIHGWISASPRGGPWRPALIGWNHRIRVLDHTRILSLIRQEDTTPLAVVAKLGQRELL